MTRAVFTAALTGPVEYAAGRAVLRRLDFAADPDRVLTDHAACYPPPDAARPTVLEPLYPDRLAEDFLGVTIPGHATDQPAYPWAVTTATSVLGRIDETKGSQASRVLTFLAAATERWPYVGETFLYPLLRREPELADVPQHVPNAMG